MSTVFFRCFYKAPQTSAIRTYLRGKYAAVMLYQAQDLHVPRDPLDLPLSPGDLVGVIQRKDPMGSEERWYVDNGQAQGFVPRKVLASIGEAKLAPPPGEKIEVSLVEIFRAKMTQCDKLITDQFIDLL